MGFLGTLHSAPAERLAEPVGGLPTTPELERWFASAKEVEHGLRKGEARFTLEMKKAHVYAKVLKSGEVIGRFRPGTIGTSVQAEITTFNIGRALGCGELFQPAVAMDLRGKGFTTFRHQLEAATFPEHKVSERATLLQAMEDDPGLLRGVYKPVVPAGAVKYTAIERVDEPPNGGLETNDVIARYLRHDAPMPDRQLIALPLNGFHAAAGPLARQLSNIMLVDALAGQWDRFSGHNLHLLHTAEGPQFMAIDNGGADPAGDQGYLEKFTHWVTRFDPAMAERLAALDAFLRKRGHFLGFTNEHELELAIGFDDARDWKAFKERVHRVNDHVRSIRTGGRFEP